MAINSLDASLRVVAAFGSQILPCVAFPTEVASYQQAVTPTRVPILSVSHVIESTKQVYNRYGWFSFPGFWGWFNLGEGLVDALTEILGEPLKDRLGVPNVHRSPYSDIQNAENPFTGGWKEALSEIALISFRAVLNRPFVVARTRLLAQQRIGVSGELKYKGLLQTLGSLKNEYYGFTSLGLVPSVISGVLYGVVSSTYDANRASVFLLKRFANANPLFTGVLHAVSLQLDTVLRWGLICLVMWPFELVARRLDLQGSGVEPWVGAIAYKSWTDCFSRIIREEGFSSLYKGAFAEYLANVVPATVFGLVTGLAINLAFGPPPEVLQEEEEQA
jgi:hypothetical protein